MNKDIEDCIKKYGDEIWTLFTIIKKLIIQSVPCNVEEKLWAKLPSYYIGDNFIRIIPFKDHINIEAAAIMEHKHKLEQYKITPKGMLQIYVKDEIPSNILQKIFKETLA